MIIGRVVVGVWRVYWLLVLVIGGMWFITGCCSHPTAVKQNQIQMHDTFTKGTGTALKNYRGTGRRAQPLQVRSY